jgi:protein SCO1/2
MKWLLAIALLCISAARVAGATPPDAAALEFRQHLGRAMPPVQGLHDQNGQTVGLADYLGKRPVIFVLGYYHCPMLCSTLMDAVLESLRGIGVPYEVVAVSIDPSETPRDAARKYGYYSGLMAPGMSSHLHLLTAPPSAIGALTEAVGFPYQRDPDTGQYFHPAGFVILTPQGQISRYIFGVGYARRDIRLALVEASGGKVGSLADRLVLLCCDYDPRTGRYSVAAMAMARAAGLGTLAALLIGLFFLRRGSRKREGA